MLLYRGQLSSELAVDATIEQLGGNFTYPLKYGYAAVGRVVGLGAEVETSWLTVLFLPLMRMKATFWLPQVT